MQYDTSPRTASFFERDGRWHHLAVTWSAEKTSQKNGETIIYMDGMEVGRAQSEQTEHLQRNGALMLGGEQVRPENPHLSKKFFSYFLLEGKTTGWILYFQTKMIICICITEVLLVL